MQVRGAVLSELCAYSANLDAIRPDCRLLDHSWSAMSNKLNQFEAPDGVLGSGRAIERELSNIRTLLNIEDSIDQERLAETLKQNAMNLHRLRDVLQQELAHEVGANEWTETIALLAASSEAASLHAKSWQPERLVEFFGQLWKTYSEVRSEWKDKVSFQLDRSEEQARESLIETLRLLDLEPAIERDRLAIAVSRLRESITPIRGNLSVGKLVAIPKESSDQLVVELDELLETCSLLENELAAEKPGLPTELRGAVNKLSERWNSIAPRMAPLRARIYVDSQTRLEFYHRQARALVGLHNFSESSFLQQISLEVQAHAKAMELDNLAAASANLSTLVAETKEVDSSKVEGHVENLVRNSQSILDEPSNPFETTVRRKIAILSAGWNP